MDPTGIDTVRWTYPPAVAAPTRARRRLARQLAVWGVTASDAEPVLLVVYELTANAVEHARTPLELTVSFDGSSVVVEVRDESAAEPLLQPMDAHAERGRGLQMVAALAKTWKCVRHPGGKTVRAVVVPGP